MPHTKEKPYQSDPFDNPEVTITNKGEKIICASYSKLSKELTNGHGILVHQAVCKLWIKTVKIRF